ncbi:uncharacterized protein LOC112692604 isoform X2 [Sipha flava]|uniref:Uncharacterized protein LOC112692604 isoform X2 n=1 Tax=Sipha flava TaxID=143950 RepID=A0A8B8GJA9_9HEMI|nr:uncharacterized protein LOC112692604 isoform X2 [Sipha flava]
MLFNINFLKVFGFCLFLTAAAQKSNYKYIGCYLGENLLSLGEESRVLNPISPKSCSEFCSAKKYLFFILKNDTCYCSKHYISRLMKEFDHVCTKKCAGDNQATCGGTPNFVSSYTTDSLITSNYVEYGSFPIPIYLGCYSEIPNDEGNRLLKGPAQPYSNNTPQRCSEICFKKGYLYFGVTYGSECWCGNQKPLKISKVEDANCNSPCSGDSKQFCGGGWKMGIYSTGITDFLAKKYEGCFENEEKKNKGKNLSFNMEQNNSPRRCMNLCNTQRFKYAAVNGNICECMKNEPSIGLKRSFSDCSTSCLEDPSEKCGGSVTRNIYKTLYSDQQGKVKMDRIGCFNNFKRHPILNGWEITSNHLTPKNCVYSCYARRFPYAALTSSKECLCSFKKPSFEAKTEDNMCATPCSGSSQQLCGGNNVIDVYSTGMEWKTDAIGNYYLGCFEESQSNRMFSNSRSLSKNTPELCSTICYKLGYTYSGVTYIEGCFCGNQPPAESLFPKVEDKQCNTKCAGDTNQYCGGGWRMGVFSTGLYDFSIEGRYLGCFVMQENILSNFKFELIDTNSPSKCSTLCNNAGYQFSGVIGINCLCGRQIPGRDQRVGDTDCDTPCIGDSSNTCGGEDRIQIYDLMMIDHSGTSNSHESNNFVETFDSLNVESRWTHDIYIPQEPDYEFVFYNNSEQNIHVKNGELFIKPTIQSDSFVRRGCLTLKGCTKEEGSTECSRNASSFNILPPIVSAKLNTKNNFLFQYGKLEVEAKLPIGDWIVSEIALISKSNEKNKLILATSFGNTNLKCNGEDESAAVLKYGLKIDETYHVDSKMIKLSSQRNRWSDDYHTFEFSRSPDNIVFRIDGESNQLDTSDLPMNLIFDSEFYLSIGVSVGGMLNFRDDCLSNGHLKPWKNFDTKVMLNFWKDKNYWSTTWDNELSILRIKKIKFTSSDSIN